MFALQFTHVNQQFAWATIGYDCPLSQPPSLLPLLQPSSCANLYTAKSRRCSAFRKRFARSLSFDFDTLRCSCSCSSIVQLLCTYINCLNWVVSSSIENKTCCGYKAPIVCNKVRAKQVYKSQAAVGCSRNVLSAQRINQLKVEESLWNFN